MLQRDMTFYRRLQAAMAGGDPVPARTASGGQALQACA